MFAALTSAPLAISALAMPASPVPLAPHVEAMRAVSPSRFEAFTSAPARSKASTFEAFPSHAAWINGVLPACWVTQADSVRKSAAAALAYRARYRARTVIVQHSPFVPPPQLG